ncbi:hypothetical protein FE784_00845 [Paenibacillus hemerocallicola]|uniref:Uncharacterized protein n=1 Tax=Paenibacillus hemerocallicola TaxID=1172614 RepID=A0A5C4TIF0_9BACL|nr:hypothetical protein [Paenibacillus hemerocallicola]TNJ68240.1 hypothetical protein FE784_00845 [Paenibacillus hemerocallicola]
MARRFHYYNVFITHNSSATRLYFTDFLDKIKSINWQNRIRKINYHPTALFDLTVPNQDQMCRIASIGKYRQQIKPYIGDINSDKAQMIQNDIIEMVTFVAAPLQRTVLFEYNFYGSKVKDIEEYFNSFFSVNDPRNNWQVVFLPIDSNRSIADIKASNDIKELSIKINAGNNTFTQLLERSQAPNQKNSLFGTLMSTSNLIKQETDAPVIDISFGKGRKRKINLDTKEILGLIELLDIDNNESVQSCKVTFRNSTTGKNETLELKNVGILNDVVLEGDNGNHGWEFIGDKILEKYISKNRPRSNEFAGRGIKFIDSELPRLNTVPRERYSVPVQSGRRTDLEGDPA